MQSALPLRSLPGYARCGDEESIFAVLDSIEQARAVAAASQESGERIPALIEVDADGHRAGVAPEDPRLLQIGRPLIAGGAELRGVMTHSGGSYVCRGSQMLIAAAEPSVSPRWQASRTCERRECSVPLSALAPHLRRTSHVT
jgi:D-serine deaminase-like pyridoxal phosphate-dependent protein